VKRVNQKHDSLKDRNGQWLRAHQASGHVVGHPLLIAEDSESDVFFMLRVMDQAGVLNPIYVVRDGNETLAYLQGARQYADRSAYPIPGIVLLDLKMPGIDGFDILRWKKTQPNLQHTLMVAVSSFDGIYAINLAYETGADTFLSKPLSSDDILNLITAFENYWQLTHLAAPKLP
jgi:two-component system response regulator